jgi:hypothetical protein
MHVERLTKLHSARMYGFNSFICQFRAS